MEKPGRHRYVRLEDLVSYQTRTGQQRRDSLAQLVTDAPVSRHVLPAGPTSPSHTV
jgi:hypothetical protein